ncbi:MAG: serine/threonine dehydratase [Actinomycetota bacterium]
MPVTPADIDAAAGRIAPLVRTTPTITIDGAELGGAGTVSLKLELLQHSGSFKARGASSYLLATDVRPDGVVAASGGNHGAAVAWAARELGHAANIFVPTISAPTKVERLRAYGATVHQVGDVYAEALAASAEFLADHDATSVHAYEAELVVAGAGTTGREFDAQVPDLDAVLVACGGGGLVAGVATWFHGGAARSGTVEVVACETHGTAAYAWAREAGAPVAVEVSGVAADALGATSIGDLAFAQLQAAGTGSVLVSDDDVTAARHLLWDRFRIMTEPSAAVPVAAVLSGAYELRAGRHVGIIVCGANTAGL